MHIHVCVVAVLFTAVFAAEKNTPCITPNGENAKCISVYECSAIKKAIAYLDPDAVEFAKRSQCGHDNGALVCCGTTGRFTTPADTSGTTEPIYVFNAESFPKHVDHLYLPDGTLCGLQVAPNKKPDSKTSEIDEYPWMAALRYKQMYGSGSDVLCSGTLISDQYVLTAAECLDVSGYRLTTVVLGEWDFSSTEDCMYQEGEKICSKPIDYAIEKQIPHHFYNKSSGANNIALLCLQQRVAFSGFIRALCLPPANHPEPDVKTQMETSGWGITETGITSDVKLKRQKFMADSSDCAQSCSKINMNQLCYTNQLATEGCGDPGSPLMRKYHKSDATDEEQYYLEGIILGPNYCRRDLPCLYTKVSRYTKWILNQLPTTLRK